MEDCWETTDKIARDCAAGKMVMARFVNITRPVNRTGQAVPVEGIDDADEDGPDDGNNLWKSIRSTMRQGGIDLPQVKAKKRKKAAPAADFDPVAAFCSAVGDGGEAEA